MSEEQEEIENPHNTEKDLEIPEQRELCLNCGFYAPSEDSEPTTCKACPGPGVRGSKWMPKNLPHFEVASDEGYTEQELRRMKENRVMALSTQPVLSRFAGSLTGMGGGTIRGCSPHPSEMQSGESFDNDCTLKLKRLTIDERPSVKELCDQAAEETRYGVVYFDPKGGNDGLGDIDWSFCKNVMLRDAEIVACDWDRITGEDRHEIYSVGVAQWIDYDVELTSAEVGEALKWSNIKIRERDLLIDAIKQALKTQGLINLHPAEHPREDPNEILRAALQVVGFNI